VFLSACRTAELSGGNGDVGGANVPKPFVRDLVNAGVANVLGWDGLVYDLDATNFTRNFYAELAGRNSVPYAAGVARGEVLRAHLCNPNAGRHWHLARVYAGPGGGGPICVVGGSARDILKNVGYAVFLDKEREKVPVASAREFVGRRRQVQDILRAYRDGQAGGLIHGMGNPGKSSLAARIANRMPSHQAVVVFEDYDPMSVFERLLAALAPEDRNNWREQWSGGITANGPTLADALEAMLKGPFREKPILLVVDDLEGILEKPTPGTDAAQPVALTPGGKSEWRDALGAILRAFNTPHIESRPLLTSRFRFTLPDDRNRDLADTLLDCPLQPMESKERDKQWRATSAEIGRELEDQKMSLVRRALTIAGGNPGLQETLCRPIINGEAAAAGDAIAKVELFIETGEVPEDKSAAQEFSDACRSRPMPMRSPSPRKPNSAPPHCSLPVCRSPSPHLPPPARPPVSVIPTRRSTGFRAWVC
jgi:hypothetical protein